MKHEDRILDLCLEEAAGRIQPPDLVEQVRRGLAGQPAARPADLAQPVREVHPVEPRRRRWSWVSVAALSAAAGLVLWVGSVFGGGDVPRVELDVWVLQGELSWSGEGSGGTGFSRAATGQQVRISLFEGVQLRSGTVPTALRLAQFGTLYTESDTIVEVESMELIQRGGVIAASGVTLVVLAGAVTWNALARTEQAGIGEAISLEAADIRISGMTPREQALQNRIAELEQSLADAEARAARKRVAAEEAEQPVSEEAEPGEGPALEVRFSDDKYAAALAGVDWQVVADAMKGQTAASAELAAAILAGETPLEIAGRLQQFNGQLVGQLQPLMDGEVPGFGPNGTFTHPLVVANQVDRVLASGDAPLSEDQSARMAAITDHYLAQDENLRIRGEGHELSLETILEETAMKDRFYEEVAQILSPEQRAMLYPDGVRDYNNLDLFATGIIWAQVAKPALVEGPEDLARRNLSRFSEGLQLDEAQRERLRPLLETWSRSYPAEYWSDEANALERQGILKTSRTRIAGERQLALFKAILANVGLTPEQRDKLLQNNGVLVPLVR